MSLAIITSQILAEAQDRGTSYATWGLAQILFPRFRRWHVHEVPPVASALALLTKHLGHGLSSGFGVQDERPSHTSLIWI